MNENKEFKLEALVEPLCLWYEKEKRSMPWRDDATPYHVMAVGDYGSSRQE